MFDDVKTIDGVTANYFVSLFSEKIVEKDKCPPDIFGRAFFMCGLHEPDLGGRPKNFGEYLAAAVVKRLLTKHEITPVGCTIVEGGLLKNSNVYKHTFRTKDGKEFYSFQFGNNPSASVNQLTASILEMPTQTGCIHCAFEGFTDEEHEVECPVCRNGATRKLLDPLYKDLLFKNHGWFILKEIIGEEMEKTLLLMTEAYQGFFKSPIQYCACGRDLLDQYLKEADFGVYFDAQNEEIFFMNLLTKIQIEIEEDEFDDESEEDDN